MPNPATISFDKERSGVGLEVDEQLVDDISELLDAGASFIELARYLQQHL